MSVRILKPLALSALLATAAFATPTTAKAGDGGDIVAGAILGVTAGVILGGIVADSHSHGYYDPPPYRPYRRPVRVYEKHYYYEDRADYAEDYDAPAYGYNAPPPRRRYYSDNRRVSYGAPRPWSKAWYRYCSNKYRSFDPGDGTYQPYEGPRRRCR